MPRPYSLTPVRDWLVNHVDNHPDTDECIEWPAAKDDFGNGLIKWEAKTQRAHRIVYQLYHPGLPDDMVVFRTCNNPACVNVHHMDIDRTTRRGGRRAKRI